MGTPTNIDNDKKQTKHAPDTHKKTKKKKNSPDADTQTQTVREGLHGRLLVLQQYQQPTMQSDRLTSACPSPA